MQVFIMINNVGIVINVGGNKKNWLVKVSLMMDLFGILVYVNVNVISCASSRIFGLCKFQVQKKGYW